MKHAFRVDLRSLFQARSLSRLRPDPKNGGENFGVCLRRVLFHGMMKFLTKTFYLFFFPPPG